MNSTEKRLIIRNNPARFFNANGIGTWSKQNEILEALQRYDEVDVKSSNAVGKTFTAAMAIFWFLLSFENSIVVTTAPTFPQVEQILWRELRAMNARAVNPFIPEGKFNNTSITLAAKWYAVGRSTDRESNFQGYHADNILFVGDEANGIADEIITAMKGSLTGPNAKLLLIGNPIIPSGYFYNVFNRKNDNAKTLHISAFDSPNITGEKNIPGLADAKWIADRKAEWGESSNIYQSRVLGEFPSSSDKSMFNILSVVKCMTSGTETYQGGVALGVDVARHGKDETVFVEMRNNKLEIIQTWKDRPITDIRNFIFNWSAKNKGLVGIDDGGVGGGVVDMCREAGINTVAFISGYRANNSTLFENLKAEAMWQLSEAINAHEIVLPNDEVLKDQIRNEGKDFTAKGKIKVIDPDDSPDRLDAVNIAYYAYRLQTRTKERVYGGYQ